LLIFLLLIIWILGKKIIHSFPEAKDFVFPNTSEKYLWLENTVKFQRLVVFLSSQGTLFFCVVNRKEIFPLEALLASAVLVGMRRSF